MSTETVCPGCGVVLPRLDGPTHAYIEASPACWALYGEVLAREYQDPAYFAVHQLTVDAYAAQHPGGRDPRATRSVALHLMTLCIFLERGADPAAGPRLHKQFADERSRPRLDPPRPIGSLTVADVHRARGPDAHAQAVQAWAADVWEAWRSHHVTVRGWVDEALGS